MATDPYVWHTAPGTPTRPTQQDIDSRAKALELAKTLKPTAPVGDLIRDAVKIEAYLKTGKAN